MFVLSSLSCVIWWKNKHQWKGYQSDKMTYLKCWFEKTPLLSLSLVWLNWCFSEQLRRKFSQSVSSSLALYLFFFFPPGVFVLLLWSFCCWFICLFACLFVEVFFWCLLSLNSVFEEDSSYNDMIQIFFHKRPAWFLDIVLKFLG